MWSYVQYRRLGKQLEEELKNRPSHVSGEKRASRLESDQSLALQDGDQQIDGLQEKDNHHRVVSSGDDDPLDPKNWPLLHRSKNIAILSFLIFVQGWAGAAESMANTKASEEFGVSKVAETLSTAMYLFGIGSGSLLAGPLSETYGRNPVYLVSTFCYLFFILGCALTPTFGGQVVCRYLVGLSSSATLSINGSSVRDQFRPVKRAFVFPVIAWANVACKSPQYWTSKRVRLMNRISTRHRAHRGRLDRREHEAWLALDRLDNSDHFCYSLRGGAALPSGDLSPVAAGLEGKTSSSYHRRRPVCLSPCRATVLLQEDASSAASTSHILCERARHHRLRRLSHSPICAPLLLSFRFRVHLREDIQPVTRTDWFLLRSSCSGCHSLHLPCTRFLQLGAA